MQHIFVHNKPFDKREQSDGSHTRKNYYKFKGYSSNLKGQWKGWSDMKRQIIPKSWPWPRDPQEEYLSRGPHSSDVDMSVQGLSQIRWSQIIQGLIKQQQYFKLQTTDDRRAVRLCQCWVIGSWCWYCSFWNNCKVIWVGLVYNKQYWLVYP